jgi:thiol oxidase
LYSPEDPIICMEGDEVTKLTTNSENCWAVEFYSSWCGHCHNFAPTFKEIARDVAKWGGRLKIGVIDCSEGKNQNPCREYNVMGYPSVKLIHAKEEDPQHSKAFVGGRSADEVKLAYLELLKTQTSPPNNWPDFNSLSFGDYLRLESSNLHKVIVLAFSDAKSSLALELVVLFTGKDKLIVRAVIDDPVMASHMSVDTNDLPAVVFIRNKERKVLQKPPENKNLVTHYEKLISELVEIEVDKRDSPTLHTKPVSLTPGHSVRQPINASVEDILSAVGFAFHNEVPMHSMVSGPAFTALLEFVMLLEQVYSRLLPEVGVALKKVSQELHIAKPRHFITRRDWLKMIQQENSGGMQAFPTTPHWYACKGTSPEHRGYPCGLWMLMHTATVLTHPVVNQLPRTKPSHLSVSYGSQDSLRIVSAFISNFFTCEDCREHFSKMSTNIGAHVKNSADGILWLWCAHNAVNKRTAGTMSEDPGFPKVQFPTSKECPKCHWSGDGDRTPDSRCTEYALTVKDDDDTNWNEHEVMFHLCMKYGHSHVTSDKCRLLATAADVGRHSIPTEATQKQTTDLGSNHPSPSKYYYFVFFIAIVFLIFAFGKFRRRIPRLLKVAGHHSHLL